ncbi:MAG: 30S ribosome-binding factor RbfA [Candidatus Omnitrophica bacterium]|nr:30S ribosome-binding factor RbfA [Candidatus Omnitrophota bacterium]
MSARAEKVAQLIREELCSIFQDELKDPRIGFVTITKVNLTADLRFARVYFSVIGDEKAKNETLAVLKKATGFIRSQLGERIRLRFTPEISFRFDDSLDYSQHIEDLLKQTRQNKDKRGVAGSE